MTFTFFINLFTNMIMNDPKKTWKKIYLQRNSVKQIFKIQSPKFFGDCILEDLIYRNIYHHNLRFKLNFFYKKIKLESNLKIFKSQIL